MKRFSVLRARIQTVWTLFTNAYAAGFARGAIFQGASKGLCVPGLNCYSCPAALFSCPVGAFQASLAGTEAKIPFYVLGLLFAFGSVLGRFVCGWLCPFGLLQDFLHKIPFPVKMKRLPHDRRLRRAKYAVLVLCVVLLPLLTRDGISGTPFFCKYVCPSGTVFGGWPLSVADSGIRSALGALFAWKSALALALLCASAAIFRPFCKYLCPLGAFYALFNGTAVLRLRFDAGRCTHCGKCASLCPMDVELPARPNSAECVRCMECVSACPTGALSASPTNAPHAAKEAEKWTSHSCPKAD